MLRFPGFPLPLSELLQVLERESGIRKPIPLLDNFGVHQGAIFEVDIGQGPSIFVVALLVIF
jgi:hypothetical protein